LKINFRSRVQVSPALAEWLEKLVAPELESRFSTAEQALTALKQSQWVNKKNWLKVGMSVAELATVGFLGFLGFHYRWILLSRLEVYPVGCNTGAIETYLEQGGRLEKLVTSRDSAFWCGAERDYAGDSVAESFISVAASGKVDIMERLLAIGVAVNVQDKDGKTPLHGAARNGNVEVVKRLLSAGAEVNVRDDFGETPLHDAADEGNVEVVKRLLSAGAEVNVRDDFGETPLHDAALRGNVEVVKHLLSAGANPNIQDQDGDTALDVTDDEEVRELLRRHSKQP
jgi:hypothetical protein